MALPICKCRGFTNPVMILVRTSLDTPTFLSSTSCRSSARTGLSWLLRWNSATRHIATSQNLRARPKPSAKTAKSTRPSPSPAVRTAPAPTPAPTPSPTPSLAKAIDSAPQLGYAQSLARRGAPTTLYEAAPHRMFLFSSYMAGLFGVLAGGVNVWFNVYNPPEGTAPWIIWSFGAVGICMAALGTRFAMMPAAVVRSITVLPAPAAASASAAASPASKAKAAVSAAAGAAAAATATAASPAAPRVLLEIKARRMSPFPFLPLKRLRVDPGAVLMKARLYNPPPRAPTAAELAAQREADEARRAAERQYELDHIMTAPFRHGAWAAGTILSGIRRGLTGEGFAPLIVNGHRYKLDITKAYVLDDGRALDRIVRIDEDPELHRAAKLVYSK